MKGKTTLPPVSVYEAEALLLESMNMLKNPENLEPIKGKLVGEFWEDGWRRAPFEECLTFKQLSSIHFDTLIKKRPFDCDKIHALSLAVKKAIALGGGKIPPAAEERKPYPPHGAVHHRSLPEPAPGMSSTQAALYIGLREFANAIPENHSLAPAARKIFDKVDQISLVSAWSAALASPVPGRRPVSASTGSKKARTADNSKAKEQIAGIFQTSAPECRLHWATALTGAGASAHHLIDPYLHAKPVPEIFMRDLCGLLLWAIGAQPVLLGKRVLPDHYSLSPNTASKIIGALKLPKKASKEMKRSILSLPFPFFDHDALIKALL